MREILLDLGFKNKSEYYKKHGISDLMCNQIGYRPKEIYEISIEYGESGLDRYGYDFVVTIADDVITLVSTQCRFDCCGDIKYRGEFDLNIIKKVILGIYNWYEAKNIKQEDLDKLKVIENCQLPNELF